MRTTIVCISDGSTFKAASQFKDAVMELNDYLQFYPADAEGWQEQAHLYIAAGRLDMAAFCLEELLLLRSENYVHHLEYAELLYTQGDVDVARSYFAQAVELNPACLRALYGLYLCTVHSKARGAHVDRLQKWSLRQILDAYRAHAPHLLSVVEAALS